MFKVVIGVLFLWPALGNGQDITITPEGMEIMSVYFAGGSYYLDAEQKQKVHDWLNGKEDLHEYEIMLHSHTDNIGSLSYNQFLSKMRSEETLRALEEIMISRDDVRVQDFGELNPLFDNTTLNGRFNNRRVDIILASAFVIKLAPFHHFYPLMKVHLLQAGITSFLTRELANPTDAWLLPHSLVNHFHATWYNHPDLSLYARYDQALRSEISQRWWKRENYRPKEIMLTLIETDPELAGIAWKDLAQQNANLDGRLSRFTYYCEQLLDMYRARHPRAIETYHHQDADILSLYLAGLFPDLYALYPGLENFQLFCKNVGSPDIPKVDDLVRYMKVIHIVNTYLQRDPLLTAFFEKRDPLIYKVQPITMIIAYEIVQFMASQESLA